MPTPNQWFFGSTEFTCPPSWFLNLFSPHSKSFTLSLFVFSSRILVLVYFPQFPFLIKCSVLNLSYSLSCVCSEVLSNFSAEMWKSFTEKRAELIFVNLPTVVTPVGPLEDLGPVQKILKWLHTCYKSLALNNLTALSPKCLKCNLLSNLSSAFSPLCRRNISTFESLIAWESKFITSDVFLTWNVYKWNCTTCILLDAKD